MTFWKGGMAKNVKNVRNFGGHVGGSFEESFPVDVFLEAAFSEGVLPPNIDFKRELFERCFDCNLEWFKQLEKFVANQNKYRSMKGYKINKRMLAEAMALTCEKIPPTYLSLVELIKDVREDHPIMDPNDVELPEIPGLTC